MSYNPLTRLRLAKSRRPRRYDSPEPAPILLTTRRIYIMPDRYGLLFGLVLVVMLAGAINYTLSLGYMLTFLVAGIFLVSILHTFRNMLGLSIRPGRAEPVFAGTTARLPLILENSRPLTRYAIGVTLSESTTDQEARFIDLEPATTLPLMLEIPAPVRGVLRPGRITLFTHHPLGVIRAWAHVHPDLTCLVYPTPESGPVPDPTPPPGEAEAQVTGGPGEEDFHALRPYQQGDPPRQIHWKASARQERITSKQFSDGPRSQELHLRWEDTGLSDTEARLSRLCRWILDLDRQEIPYGLEIPGTTLEPAIGAAHRHLALEALARFSPNASATHGRHRGTP
ncbi:MAG: DUF58 domain-containing protein [Magnetococcales bacterium]|nr:DUF58 domain-containing protein [Magnetococcales bacterium]